MKQRLLIPLFCAVAFAASAQTPAPTAEPHDLRAADARNETATQALCLEQTGSLITKAHNDRIDRRSRSGQASEPKQCAPAAGRSYSRRDIQRTGAPDLAEALRDLDPTIH